VNANSLAVEPAYRSVPPYTRTFGPEVADLAELAGFGPDPEQAAILDAIFAVDRHGRSVAFSAAAIACRQNLKTGLFKQAVLGWLFITDQRLIVWSAHEFSTTQEAFRDLDTLITGSDVLRRRVKHIYRGNGDERIELTDDRRLIFKARTKGGGRGLSGDKVILDEAFALQPMHMGALLPTLSARPDPQVLYGSSAGLAESAVLRGVRDRGRAGGDPRLAYFEWCASPPAVVCEAGDRCTHALTTPGCGCDDPENWQRANPAIGRRISIENIAAERRDLPPAEFGRERMGWWDDPEEDAHPFPVDDWGRRVDTDAPRPAGPALAVAVTRDRSMAAIGAAGRVEELSHVDVVDHRAGTGWIVDRAVELYDETSACALVLDPAGPAGALEKDLTAKDDAGRVKFSTKPGPGERRLVIVTAREYAQAYGALVDDVVNDRLRHRDRAELNTAVRGVRTRPLADAYAPSRKDSPVDVTPLEVVTLARHGFATHGLGATYDVLESVW
jgi:hypothetical protein